MAIGEIREVTFSKSLERTQGEVIAEYMDLIKEEIAEEIRRIILHNELLGEGRTARVFDITVPHSPVPICVKIWHQGLENLSQIELRKIQYSSPIEEFKLQDELFLSGFKATPEPISMTQFDTISVMAMERIVGYTLRQIMDAGARIVSPKWSDLERLIMEMHKKYHVAHRDLGPHNIMLATDQKLEPGAEMSGKLIIIDFGLSKATMSTPEDDDYALTIGKDSVRYAKDFDNIDALKPRRGHEQTPFVSK